MGELENELSASVGHRYGIALSSGTAALYCSLRALGVGKGDNVIIPSYVCTALVNAVAMAGGEAVLADIDPSIGLVTYDSVKAVMRRKTRAVIVPHLFGLSASAAEIEKLGAPVVEDCAQCVGGELRGWKTGGMTTVSIFSFYATKVINAGEGGMVACSDKSLFQRVADIRDYDNRGDAGSRFNFKLTEMQAAMAVEGVREVHRNNRIRSGIARRYTSALSQLKQGLLAPIPPSDMVPTWFRYVARSRTTAAAAIRRFEQEGIDARRPVFKPLHRYLGREGYPGTEELYRRAVSIPLYPDLRSEEIARVITALTK